MTYIIYDLELTVSRKNDPAAEIIEIGAAKVAERDGRLQIVDTFQIFVKPLDRPVLSSATTEFTGITQEDMRAAKDFPDALEDFLKWIGEDEYFLCSWGIDDRYYFVKHCKRYKLPLEWLKNYNDIQRDVSKKCNTVNGKRIGLTKALEHLQIPFEGRHHRGIDDAVNTAKIFIALFQDIELEQNEYAEQNYVTQVVYSAGEDTTFYPFGQLADLLGRDQ